MSLNPEVLKTVVVATGNSGKLAEIRATLDFEGWQFVSAGELGVWDPPEETGDTFDENALAKARYAAQLFGMSALADDSGLEVDALGGEPGVYSARYAGPCATDAENSARLLLALQDVAVQSRSARFRCAMALVEPGNSEILVSGSCEGAIALEGKGSGGFGYDPLFIPAATPARTMAQLDLAEKNSISHRGAALRALRACLSGE